jgi:hypothetical protein
MVPSSRSSESIAHTDTLLFLISKVSRTFKLMSCCVLHTIIWSTPMMHWFQWIILFIWRPYALVFVESKGVTLWQVGQSISSLTLWAWWVEIIRNTVFWCFLLRTFSFFKDIMENGSTVRELFIMSSPERADVDTRFVEAVLLCSLMSFIGGLPNKDVYGIWRV